MTYTRGKRRLKTWQTKPLIVFFCQNFRAYKHLSTHFIGLSHFSELSDKPAILMLTKYWTPCKLIKMFID